ncbi:hypothetical protein ElyMa_000516500 [Elysia marginata]|uniref:Uncharacterized protein n=1 Tax=Elysia marginata TaxID=1093978 RepID=A0AAV4FYL0_9GAST|nr:hypothetical protein ElyMa_000516500 [Elysia marginata]
MTKLRHGPKRGLYNIILQKHKSSGTTPLDPDLTQYFKYTTPDLESILPPETAALKTNYMYYVTKNLPTKGVLTKLSRRKRQFTLRIKSAIGYSVLRSICSQARLKGIFTSPIPLRRNSQGLGSNDNVRAATQRLAGIP